MSGFNTIQAANDLEKDILCQVVIGLVQKDRQDRWAEDAKSFWEIAFKIMKEQHGTSVENQRRLEREYDKMRAGAVEKYGQDADEKEYLRQRREFQQPVTSTSGQALASTRDLTAALPAVPQPSDQSDDQAGQSHQAIVSDLPIRQRKA